MPRASSQLRAFLIVSQFLIPYMVIVIRPSSHMPPCRWKGARIQHSAPQAVKEPERLGFAWAVGSPATVAALVLFLKPGHQRPETIGRAHVLTPVTNAHLVRRLLLETKTTQT